MLGNPPALWHPQSAGKENAMETEPYSITVKEYLTGKEAALRLTQDDRITAGLLALTTGKSNRRPARHGGTREEMRTML